MANLPFFEMGEVFAEMGDGYAAGGLGETGVIKKRTCGVRSQKGSRAHTQVRPYGCDKMNRYMRALSRL
jgi:hypothetical protein